MGEATTEQTTAVPGYRPLRVLSRGSLGELCLARREEDEEEVLLRVASPELARRGALEARLREDLARLARVDHPAVARILGYAGEGERLWYALRHPGRITLLRFVKEQRRLRGDELLWLARGLAHGIRALHAERLFHGDVWPGKVALCVQGPVLVELGWARRFRDPNCPADERVLLADWRGLAASLVYAASGELPAASGEGCIEAPRGWSEGTALPPEVRGVLDRLLAPPGEAPSLAELARVFLRDPVPSLPDSLAPLLGAEPEPASERPTAILEPQDSVALRLPPAEEERTEDEPTTSARGPTELELPPRAHLLRPGFEVAHRRVLGRGGMGVVYLVHDPLLGRDAALKLVRGAEEHPSRVRRFRREIKVTARLDHPGIPAVFEAGRTPDGQDYLLMHYVEGESLQDVIAARRREQSRLGVQRDLLHALVKVAETVAYAHSRGIVHRDLKPANVMIGAFGEVYVMDWGLARDLAESDEEDRATCTGLGAIQLSDISEITQDGVILGTPGYIPPEQAYGEDVDPRADVFALGAILTEILTGKAPVSGSDLLERVELTRAGQIERPRQRDRDLNPELDAIAAAAIAFDREDRYESAQAFAEDLLAYLEGRDVSVYSYRIHEQAWRWARRHATLSVSLFIAVLLSVAGAVQVTRVRSEQREERRRQCQVLTARGRAALREGRIASARELFVQALGFEPTNADAVIGKHEADRLAAEAREAELARRRREEALAKARRLVAAGEAHRARGELEEARRCFEQALAEEGAPAEASEGLLAVKALLAKREAEAEVRRRQARDAGRARRHLEEARALMSGRRPDYEQAQVALIKAVAFGSEEARALLAKNEELLLEQRLRERQLARARRDAASAARLVGRGEEAFAAEKLEEAKAAFLQALAFQGENEAAQRGLVRVDRALQSRRAARERRRRAKSASALRRRARQSMERARRAAKEAPGRDQGALEAYFAGLVAYDRALVFAPKSERLREEKLAAVREVAAYLRERGRIEFADFLLRYGGAKEAEPEAKEAGEELLAFREADAVTVRNAFGGAVRFAPTPPDALSRLRFLLGERKGRYRVLVQVRSEASQSNPPKVYATGVLLRVEDTRSRTVFPLLKVPFARKYPRRVTVRPAGRVVGTFAQALGAELRVEERRIVEAVQRLIEAKEE
ncbi:MAG: hypothetical protein D6731_08820 [Planctomycetota bacterium]|nr:MAG: hypothetical protein D6731_08820 [Planctomycetota bacterium]